MPDSFRKHYNINIIMTEIVVNMVYMYILYTTLKRHALNSLLENPYYFISF